MATKLPTYAPWMHPEVRPSFFATTPDQVAEMWALIDACMADPRGAVRAAWRGILAQHPGSSRQFRTAVRLAVGRGHGWTLTPAQYDHLTAQPCAACDGPLGNGIGLDRLDNARGYDPDNVRPCCGPCNMLRGRAPLPVS